jgi:hypothetical protein
MQAFLGLLRTAAAVPTAVVNMPVKRHGARKRK